MTNVVGGGGPDGSDIDAGFGANRGFAEGQSAEDTGITGESSSPLDQVISGWPKPGTAPHIIS